MVVLIIVETELIMVEMVTQVELIMHRSGDEDEDAEPENCAAPLTCKEKVSSFLGFRNVLYSCAWNQKELLPNPTKTSINMNKN